MSLYSEIENKELNLTEEQKEKLHEADEKESQDRYRSEEIDRLRDRVRDLEKKFDDLDDDLDDIRNVLIGLHSSHKKDKKDDDKEVSVVW